MEILRITKFALQFPNLSQLLENVFQPNQVEPKAFLELYEFLLNSYEEASSNNSLQQTILHFHEKVIVFQIRVSFNYQYQFNQFFFALLKITFHLKTVD